jgi:hypothetical protein
MSLGQLMRMPGRQPVPDRLLADLIFRHRRDELVVHEQAIDEQCFVAGRVRGLEFSGLALLRILNAGQQRRFEQIPLMFELLRRRPLRLKPGKLVGVEVCGCVGQFDHSPATGLLLHLNLQVPHATVAQRVCFNQRLFTMTRLTRPMSGCRAHSAAVR